MKFDSVLTLCKCCKKQIVVACEYEDRNKPYFCSKRCRDMNTQQREEDNEVNNMKQVKAEGNAAEVLKINI